MQTKLHKIKIVQCQNGIEKKRHERKMYRYIYIYTVYNDQKKD